MLSEFQNEFRLGREGTKVGGKLGHGWNYMDLLGAFWNCKKDCLGMDRGALYRKGGKKLTRSYSTRLGRITPNTHHTFNLQVYSGCFNIKSRQSLSMKTFMISRMEI